MNALQRLFDGRLPRLVMFDLDGTLIDSVPDLAAAVDRMLVSLGRPPAGVERVRDWVGNGARVLVRRALAGGIDHSAVHDEDAEKALEIFLEAYADSHALTEVYPGVAETLKWLRKRKIELALITNKPERFVAPLLDQMKLGRYFPLIIAGDTLPQQKPDPAALLHVMHMTGVSRNEALFIGDSRNDVLAAKAAGVKCVALSYGYNHGRPIDEEEPALVVDDLRELLPGGCAAHGAALMSPDSPDHLPHRRDRNVLVPCKLWLERASMRIIKAVARWRWRA
ncbi:phosphoglycolate phosphatase, bacterial [Pseudomonas sp. 1D4]|jgi:phosphoglycolate phosphatase|uniref:Phosphoglycolate phosphatase n=1 Tax=Metapseudomonas otitidis TaxID=319939 RepID=A0A1I0SRA8_9GAMM|nr:MULTISPECIES: phosphoglycolate phosphatase [Pseudomonas]MDL5600029.1 phosphoglycolate phosphatase [Bacillus subtilis]KIV71674.1 Phosphoglycolate phosphatase [Pseudomonas sp. FeS53a]MBO2928230.1 phosphoglycolate phosphatase [Pseudomonas otitidis]MCP1618832.1 phosphoglycolate phosphatase [Pseudomonas otitidis]MDG9784397.1 phosphoglycolate phosphatase [Pseudomonas otitidis]